MPEEKNLVKMTVRVPQELSEAIDKAVELGIFPSKNQFVVEAIREYLCILGFAISIRVRAKKKADKPLGYYRFLAEGLQEAMLLGVGEAYTALSERVGVALTTHPVEHVEKVGKEIEQLVNVNMEENAAESGDASMPEDHPTSESNGGDPKTPTGDPHERV